MDQEGHLSHANASQTESDCSHGLRPEEPIPAPTSHQHEDVPRQPVERGVEAGHLVDSVERAFGTKEQFVVTVSNPKKEANHTDTDKLQKLATDNTPDLTPGWTFSPELDEDLDYAMFNSGCTPPTLEDTRQKAHAAAEAAFDFLQRARRSAEDNTLIDATAPGIYSSSQAQASYVTSEHQQTPISSDGSTASSPAEPDSQAARNSRVSSAKVSYDYFNKKSNLSLTIKSALQHIIWTLLPIEEAISSFGLIDEVLRWDKVIPVPEAYASQFEKIVPSFRTDENFRVAALSFVNNLIRESSQPHKGFKIDDQTTSTILSDLDHVDLPTLKDMYYKLEINNYKLQTEMLHINQSASAGLKRKHSEIDSIAGAPSGLVVQQGTRNSATLTGFPVVRKAAHPHGSSPSTPAWNASHMQSNGEYRPPYVSPYLPQLYVENNPGGSFCPPTYQGSYPQHHSYNDPGHVRDVATSNNAASGSAYHGPVLQPRSNGATSRSGNERFLDARFPLSHQGQAHIGPKLVVDKPRSTNSPAQNVQRAGKTMTTVPLNQAIDLTQDIRWSAATTSTTRTATKATQIPIIVLSASNYVCELPANPPTSAHVSTQTAILIPDTATQPANIALETTKRAKTFAMQAPNAPFQDNISTFLEQHTVDITPPPEYNIALKDSDFDLDYYDWDIFGGTEISDVLGNGHSIESPSMAELFGVDSWGSMETTKVGQGYETLSVPELLGLDPMGTMGPIDEQETFKRLSEAAPLDLDATRTTDTADSERDSEHDSLLALSHDGAYDTNTSVGDDIGDEPATKRPRTDQNIDERLTL